MRNFLCLLGVSTLLISACAAENPAATESTSAPTTIATTTTEPDTRGDDLEARARQLRTDVAAGASIVNWHSTRCNQLYGFVRTDDPVESLVVEENLAYAAVDEFEEGLRGTEISDVDGVTSGTVEFGSTFAPPESEPWTFENDEWVLDNCPTDVGVGVSIDASTEDEAGLTARVAEVNDAWNADNTGYYQFLSQRCRVAASEVYGQYLSLALDSKTRSDSDNVLLDDSDIEIVSLEGGLATTEPIFSANWLNAGTAADRWIFEERNWFYDGCPTEDEQAARIVRDVAAIAAAHPSLPLRITGLSRIAVTDSQLEGITQRAYSYNTTTSMPWWDAQYFFIQTRTATALKNAGYEVTIGEDGDTIEAIRNRDEKAKITVLLEAGTGADKEIQAVTITLRYG